LGFDWKGRLGGFVRWSWKGRGEVLNVSEIVLRVRVCVQVWVESRRALRITEVSFASEGTWDMSVISCGVWFQVWVFVWGSKNDTSVLVRSRVRVCNGSAVSLCESIRG
jgi:hypothetical protein